MYLAHIGIHHRVENFIEILRIARLQLGGDEIGVLDRGDGDGRHEPLGSMAFGFSRLLPGKPVIPEALQGIQHDVVSGYGLGLMLDELPELLIRGDIEILGLLQHIDEAGSDMHHGGHCVGGLALLDGQDPAQ